MKAKFIIFQMYLLLSIVEVFAQEKVEVTISNKEMSIGSQTAFTVFIPESQPQMVESQWKKFINKRSLFDFASKGTSQTVEKAFIGISNIFSPEKKTFTKNSLKVEKKGDELVVKNVIHEEVTQDHIDVFARITKSEKGVYLSSFFRYSDSIFINETNVKEEVLSSLQFYIREFGIETYRKVVEEQIFNEEKELRKQNGILKNRKRNAK